MAGDVSFDVVSDFDQQELVNALDQARREIQTRYDFKGAKAEFELGKAEITLKADSDSRARAMRDLLESKAIRRGLSLKIFDWKITKLIRDEFPKAKSQIQGDAIRVSSKSKDELQKVIGKLRQESEGYPVPLQFENFRD